MNPAFIIAIIAASVAVIAFIISLISDSPIDAYSWEPFAVIATLSFAFAVASGIVGLSVYETQYSEETVEICSEKGGVVSKDNLCVVDGKPVEFSPGVWQR